MATILSIDHLIVYAFLLITLVIGLLAGSGIKDIREYAIGNKRFGTGVLTMTMLATYITGAQGIGYVGYVFEDGILPIFSLLICGNIITYLCIARYIAPKIQHFQDCLTLPEVMGKLYGPRVRWAIGILGACYSVAIVTLQIIWLGYVGEFFDLPQHLSVFLGGTFLVFYAARGGMKAVAITDVLQFIAILVFVPLVAYIVLYRVGGIKALLSQVPEHTWAVLRHPSLKDYVVYCIWDLFPAFPLSFPFMQRMLMAKDKKQLVDSYYVGMSFLSVFYVLLTLIGLSAIVLHQTIDVHMPQRGSNVFVYLVKNYLPVGARGIVCTGLIAGVISTADSFLHSAGVVLAHDVMPPAIKKKVGVLQLARYITFLLGIAALSTAMYYKALPQDLYDGGLDLGKGLNFITEVVALIFTVPLVAGVMGLKTDTRSFLVSSVSTVVMFVLSPYYLTKQWALPIAITTNLLSFFGTHYLRYKGFVVVRQTTKQYTGQLPSPTQGNTRSKLSNLLPSLKKFFFYSQKNIEEHGSNPSLFALFIAFSYMIPFFMHSYAEPATYNWLLAVRGIGALLCVGLLLQAYWPERWIPYFLTYYRFCLLYCLPFVTTVLLLFEGGNTEWIVNVTLAIMFLIVLVDWFSFIVITVLGVVLGFVAYQLAIGPINLRLDFSTRYLLVYQSIFATLIGLLFARRKQQRFDTLAVQNKALMVTNQENQTNLLEAFREKVQILQTIRHAGVQDLLQLCKMIRELRVQARQQDWPLSEIVTQFESVLIPMTLQLRSLEAKATSFLRLSIQRLSVQDLLHTLQVHLVTKHRHQPIQYYAENQMKVISCDPKRLQALLISSITMLQTDNETVPLVLGIEETQLRYKLPSVKLDYYKQVPALRFTITRQPKLPAIKPYYNASIQGATLASPETAQELVLLENRRIVGAHYGYMKVTPSALYYVLPLQLQEIKPADIDEPHMELGAAPIRADDHYPGAQAKEKAFLEAVKQKSTADIELVKSVLELIKWYHGPFKRQTGEPFYLHPLEVAHIVLDYNPEETTILAALLHDMVEDTAMLLGDVEAVFGKETADIIDTVTHLESHQDSCYKVKLSAEENIMMLLENGDDRAMYVKLADRLHNMRTIEGKDELSQIRIAKETLQFFVSQSQRLHMRETAQELKERSWRVLKQRGQEL
ncbi:MAG: HD domain-containing protein [Amoebophilaceae bacterium]|jgi:Na+/proline symporter|nr:HD domain-containing protein [Amoebophilaceae bacterium]